MSPSQGLINLYTVFQGLTPLAIIFRPSRG
jgi:hypothetical protein